MAEKFAYRNLRLCTKDCLCLYVCPTGATDTENSIIDVDKCIGCGVCAEACVSGAISMVPFELPAQQPKEDRVVAALHAQAERKSVSEQAAAQIAGQAVDDGLYRLMKAVERSERIVAEDLMREGGYMLPQSGNAHRLLAGLIANPPTADFPVEDARAVYDNIPQND